MRSSVLRFSVRSRILAVILVVTALGMTVAGLSAYLVQRDRVLAGLDAELISSVEAARAIVTGESNANEGASTAAPAPDLATFDTVEEALTAIMSRLVPGRNESSIALIDGEARLIPGTEIAFHLENDPAFLDRAWSEASNGVVTLGTAVTTVGTLRYIAAPVTISGDDQVGAYIIAADAQAAVDEVGGAFVTYAGLALLSLGAIGVAGWFVSGRLLQPIRHVTETASRITAADLSERIPVNGNDDISALTETINAMLGRLDDALTAQRQLLDDVRHELKTPLTIVRGHLELVDPSSATDVEAARRVAIDELDRMNELIDDIDALARTEDAALLTEPTDVADLTALIFHKARAMTSHSWVLAESGEAIAPVSPTRITQAWLQLADNAAKYSPAGSTIRLGSSVYSTAVEFWVADEGPGIPEGSEERIFERFGRADTGRGITGSGLGLPIVATIARAHGGYVTLSSSSAGSRFGIVVPTTTEQDTPPPPALGFGTAIEPSPAEQEGTTP